MGVIFAGFVKILMPLLIVVPGIVAFKLYPNLADKDYAWPTLVRELIPAGLGGIVMAGLASGIMSHISSVLNSSSTVFTMDLYKPLLGRDKPDQHLVRVGRWSGFVILVIATVLAIWLSYRQLGIFEAVQKIGMWVAAPVAAVFLVGVMWRGATSAAATFVLIFGFPFTWFVENILFKRVSWLRPFDDSFGMNRTFVVWAVCMILLVVVSWFTKAPDPERIKGIIWSWEAAKLPEAERARNRGLRNLTLWWSIFMLIMFAVYAYMFWFQFWGPAAAAR
jgi:SSS family solute:Na+ symporter